MGSPVQPGEWSRNVLGLPVHRSSAAWLESIGLSKSIWPAFGSLYAGAPNGFLVAYVHGPSLPRRSGVSFVYASESDLVSGPTPPAGGGYLLPPDVPIESSNQDSLGDRHALVVDVAACKLYELFKLSIKVRGEREEREYRQPRAYPLPTLADPYGGRSITRRVCIPGGVRRRVGSDDERRPPCRRRPAPRCGHGMDVH